MGAFSFDVADLEKNLNVFTRRAKLEIPDVTRVPYELNVKKFTKIAFDMFRSNFDQTIWELSEEDGSRYLIKRTDLDDSVKRAKKAFTLESGAWSMKYAEGKQATLFAFGVPIREFDPKEFNYSEDSVELFANHVLEKVANDDTIAKKYVRAAKTKKALLAYCEKNIVDENARLVHHWLVTEQAF